MPSRHIVQMGWEIVVKRHALHILRAFPDRHESVLYACWLMIECVKDNDHLVELQNSMGALNLKFKARAATLFLPYSRPPRIHHRQPPSATHRYPPQSSSRLCSSSTRARTPTSESATQRTHSS